MELSSSQSDILNELLNIAMGKTASVLSQMIGRTININIPKSLLVSRQKLASLFEEKYHKNPQEDMLGVTLDFSGNCSGSTTLFFEQHQGKTLVDKLIVQQDEDWDFDDIQESEKSDEQGLLSDTDREALLEVGNMLINALMGTIGNLLGMYFDYSLPELQVPYKLDDIKPGENKNDIKDTLVLETHFIDQSEEIEGHLIIMFSLGEFTQNLLNAIDNMAEGIQDDDF
jgi:chemotaxis protein CheC